VLIPLREADGRCGAKAASLGRLLRAGVRVPGGFVVGDPIGDDGWEQEIESALLELGSGTFAVRSSAFGEDGGQASFAGQLDTTLGATTTAQVVHAVHRNARSGAGQKMAGYAARTGQVAGIAVRTADRGDLRRPPRRRVGRRRREGLDAAGPADHDPP
jgi:pyruvate,water dikinase